MMKTLMMGLWVCLLTLASSYAAAYWKADKPLPARAEEPFLEGLEHQKIEPVIVPMIADGDVQGYVIAKLVFTADARTLRDFALDAQPFIADEAFREIYQNGKVEFGALKKYDLKQLTDGVKARVNERVGIELIHDILIEEVNYAPKGSMDGQAIIKVGK